ncbi:MULTISPECIES: DUF4124 domain-containing protein [Pseudomonas]|uniref:DUF4124 domain-containing protein n=1 Tax=Pseudomonas TaxID=286 RepID=UPI003002772D
MPKSALNPCLLLITLLPTLAFAGESYRYIDSKGGVAISRQGVPPDSIARGYEVLNDQGRVIRVVPAALSREEMQQKLDARDKAAADAQLLRMYSSVEDIDRARKRGLQELDGVIGVARGNLQSVRLQQSQLQQKAAEYDRAATPVPEDVVSRINNLKGEERRLQDDIKRYQDTRLKTEASFNSERARFVELTRAQ